MLTKLSTLFTKQAKSSAGKNLPDSTEKLTVCYAEIDPANHWQGDIYSKENFNAESLPNPNIPYWMLVNRTCHLYKGKGRDIKIPYLNFIAVQPVCDYAKSQNKNLKNAIKELMGSKLEGFIFLPAYPEKDFNTHLVANFNLVHTFSVANSPSASEKLLQLSSPYCEHVFQRFSRFFYTVGYDDQAIKDDKFIEVVVDECSKLQEN